MRLAEMTVAQLVRARIASLWCGTWNTPAHDEIYREMVRRLRLRLNHY